MRHALRTGLHVALAAGTAAACAKDPVSSPTSERAALAADETPALSRGEDRQGNRKIEMYDDCDPRDPAWAPTGGCLLRRGDVTFAEFNAFLNSPLSLSVVGHQAWRMDPSYLKLRAGKTLLVTNEGGRLHTFTEVAQFGGGRVPPLNKGLTPAPECQGSNATDPTAVRPGDELKVKGLAVGNHRFQCCLHPWMREIVKVKMGEDDDH